jgi:hypothetical protein
MRYPQSTFLTGKKKNYIYNIPLPRGPGPKKNKQKDNERGINYPGGLKKTSDASRGYKISTRDGSVIDSDLTYKIWKYRSLFARCVRFEKPNKSDLPLSATRARARFTPAILVPLIVPSHLARSRGGPGN